MLIDKLIDENKRREAEEKERAAEKRELSKTICLAMKKGNRTQDVFNLAGVGRIKIQTKMGYELNVYRQDLESLSEAWILEPDPLPILRLLCAP